MVEFKDETEGDGEIEQRLRDALRPLQPPSGFADRVLACVQEAHVPRSPAFRERAGFTGRLRWSAAAVLLLAIGLGAVWAHQRQRRIEGERMRDQVLLALRITGTTIRAVQNRIAQNSNNKNQQQETP